MASDCDCHCRRRRRSRRSDSITAVPKLLSLAHTQASSSSPLSNTQLSWPARGLGAAGQGLTPRPSASWEGIRRVSLSLPGVRSIRRAARAAASFILRARHGRGDASRYREEVPRRTALNLLSSQRLQGHNKEESRQYHSPWQLSVYHRPAPWVQHH